MCLQLEPSRIDGFQSEGECTNLFTPCCLIGTCACLMLYYNSMHMCSDCVFKRNFIRTVLKQSESHFRKLCSARSRSHLSRRKNLLEDAWPLTELMDMYDEVYHYLIGVASDEKNDEVSPGSIVIDCVLWPEVRIPSKVMNLYCFFFRR